MIPARGWYVEIDDPESGHTWTPDVVGDPEINPGANDYPRITIPVRRTERWFESRYERAPMRVWRDGKRQPIEQLEDVTESEDKLKLLGRGGVELDTRVQKEVGQQEAHTVVEDIIQNNTPYAANVDEPNAQTRTNVFLQDADTESEWTSAVSIPETTPAYITSSGRLALAQSGFFAEAEDFASSGSTQSNADASDGQEQFYPTGSDSYSFSLKHTIPESEVGYAFRYRIQSGSVQNQITLQIDGQEVESIPSGAFSSDTFDWYTTGFWDNGDLTAGGHSAGFDLDGTDGEDIIIDCVHVWDQRFSTTFDNTVDSDGYLSGPELFPDRAEVETLDSTTAFQFTGAKLTSSWDDTSGGQRVGVSQDQGSSWTYADNSESIETDFASGSPELRAKFGLSRYGSRSTASPTTGFQAQSIDIYEFFGDIEETPLLLNQDYDGRAMDVVQEIADYGDFLFEFRLANGTPSVEMTTPGQRTTDDVPELSSYEYTKSVEDQVERAVIKGGRQQVRQEMFTADHGTAVSLENGNIDHGTESVYDPSTGDEFAEGADYKLNTGVETDTGSIKTLSGGEMSDGTDYAIDYNYHQEGTWTDPDAGADPTPLVETIPSITSERGCVQAATLIGRQADEPLKKARVTVPTADVGFRVVDAQQFASLPSDICWEISDITTTPRDTAYQLGSRKAIGDVVNQIERRLSAAASRT